MSATSDGIRKGFKEGDDIRDAGLTTPSDIVRFDDIVYGEDSHWQSLDVYRPAAMKGKKLPVIVSVHGGAWVYGDKERYQYYCMSLAQRGFAVVNFTYRLAPEFKFPAQLEDTNMVFSWVLDNAQEYDLDTRYVFGVGDSAGGHLLGLYCDICSNSKYARKYAFKTPEGFIPTAVALNCGAYVIRVDRPEDLQHLMLMRDLLPKKGTKEELKCIDVTAHVTSKFPPAYIMTATGDFIKELAPFMVQALSDNNVPCVYRLYGDNDNRLPHVFHCDMRSKEGRICNDEECRFFKSFIGEQE